MKSTIKTVAAQASIPALVDLAVGFGFFSVLLYGGPQIISGEKSIGEFMSFFTAIALLFEPVRRLGTIGGAAQAVFTNLERIRNIFDLNAQIVSPLKNKIERVDFSNKIIFENLYLSINEKNILNGISFTANAGETTALVGPSGAGKTTLFNLIGRLADPDSGSVKIGTIPVNRISLKGLRENLSFVSQDAWLFDESIEENIKIGNPNASDQEFRSAMLAANATEFISEMPEKEKTPVGPRGSNLSGGQRQRIAIARAILRDTPILLLDEPTSALDNKSQKQIQTALESLSKDRTTLIIAHKISTIKHSDKIVVLDAGNVVDQGTHEELLSNCKIYQSLYWMENK